MGGPCTINGHSIGPSTDNFALSSFTLNDVNFRSSEQAYQYLKMRNPSDRETIAKITPKSGETPWDYGMRCWNAGQRGQRVTDWETKKVTVMYKVNHAKISQSKVLTAELLSSKGLGDRLLKHRGSGKFWDVWNPVLLTLIREELEGEDGDVELVDKLRVSIGLSVRSGIVPTLSEIIVNSILDNSNPEMLVSLLRLEISVLSEMMREEIKFKVEDRFPQMKERYNVETLREAMGEMLYGELEGKRKRTEEEVKRFKKVTRSGSVIEKTDTGYENIIVNDSTVLPFSALKRGSKFPGIDVTNREKYLSDEEFVRVLGVSREVFSEYCKMDRIEVKKRVGLF